MKKNILSLVFASLIILLTASMAFAANKPVSLNFNGKDLPSDVTPVIKSGRTLVPIRVVSESLGADVKWDQVTQKVTIIKNVDTIELTVNAKTVVKNGASVAELDVPAQIINGRTLVPVRFVSETLGAKVSWDQATQTVSIVFAEKRDGMTPEELMLKSVEAMSKYNSYQFKGEGQITVSGTGLPQTISTNLVMEGSYKKTGVKQEVYVKETISMPEGLPDGKKSITVEMYTYGDSIYQNIDSAGWQKLNLGTNISKLLENQDPQTAMQMMKDFGLFLTHGNVAQVDGKDCYTLVVRIDAEKYKAFIKEMLSKIGPDINQETTGVNNVDFTKLFNQLVDSMNLDLSEKVYFDKSTYLMVKSEISGTVKMSVLGKSISEDLNITLSNYDFGTDVTMPDIIQD